MPQKIAIIIGAGPAGLTAAHELLKNTNIKPIVLEATSDIGGISKTVKYKGNRIDIGGHRFFSKSDKIMQWWLSVFPLESSISANPSTDPEATDHVMLLRNRLSRIYFLRKFFNYPINISLETCRKLGFIRLVKIGLSYVKAALAPILPENNLEIFFINRFGRELYSIFFKDYTEKVWGVPCSKISPEWGGQRIKGLSIRTAVAHAVKKLFKKDGTISQTKIETSLIERFMYPKFGPGQLWEEVASRVQKSGGEINLNSKVIGLNSSGNRITSIVTQNALTGQTQIIQGDHFISTMPIKDLVSSIDIKTPNDIKLISEGLIYRDFITVGLLLNRLKINNGMIPDNWIYIQEREVKLGRLQIFNNWSPYMVSDKNNVWIGLEYFCSEGDALWNMEDKNFASFAIEELISIGIIDKKDVIDQVVIRMPKTYPAYFGSYDRFDELRTFLDEFQNLYCVGRNGMHRYNNMDHSMLSAMQAVENIKNDVTDKSNIWSVNAENNYHETKSTGEK